MSGNGIRARVLAEQFRELAAPHYGKPLRERALAKVNLRLKVLGRRPDGFHLLSMLNCSASLSDEVELVLSPEPGVELELRPAGALSDDVEANLAVRAYRAFWRAFDFEQPPFGARITLEKRIPVGAGLGGGSSDAAAVLRILSGLFQFFIQADFGLSDGSFQHAISAAALECGADVPYALTGGLCRVSGIGEVVDELSSEGLAGREILIAVPPVPVPTKAFYDRFRTTHPVVVPTTDCALDRFAADPSVGLHQLIENDFEADVVGMVPEVGAALSVLRGAFPGRSGVTGSGCAVFAIPEPGEEALFGAVENDLRGLETTLFRATICEPGTPAKSAL
jgi:4-diphosphocytidyl-2-C-methyl-D-erythritol kinase